MRYRAKGVTIRSENAAKSVGEASRYVLEFIEGIEPVEASLDFGCGKLRYAHALAAKSQRIGLVDSEVQLSRKQRIDGERTSVLEYARSRWPDACITPAETFWRVPKPRYDFALCANVLSAIPSKSIRSRSVRSIYRSLRPGGSCLFVTQHTNSFFSQARHKRKSTPHLDGWILPSSTGGAYYGVLDQVALERILEVAGFDEIGTWRMGQSTFALGRRV